MVSQVSVDDRLRRSASTAYVAAAGITLAGSAGFLLARGGVSGTQYLVSGLLVLALIGSAARNVERTVTVGVLLIPFLAGLRRLISGSSAGIDPIIVLPLGLAILGVLLLRGRQHIQPGLSRLMLLFSILTTLAAFNPKQGSLTSGLVGAGLFLLIPLWFTVGRAVATPVLLRRFCLGLAAVGSLVALYGIQQVLFGFNSAEEAFAAARSASYVALNVGDTVRPFSTLSSSSEYQHICALGAIAAACVIRNLALSIVATVVCSAGVLSTAGRGASVLLFLALLMVVSARAGIGVRFAAAIAVVLLALGALGLRQLPETVHSSNSSVDSLYSHLIGGLQHPFDNKKSTLKDHREEVVNNIRYYSVNEPLGLGPGVISASGKLGNGNSASAEADIGDVLIAFGWPGWLLYFGTLVAIGRGSLVGFGRSGLSTFLAVAPWMVFNQWYVTGEYAAIALLWFSVGALDALHGSESRGRVLAQVAQRLRARARR